MKYLKKFESDESEFEEYSRRFNEKRKEYEKYLDKYLIIEIDSYDDIWIMKIKEITGYYIEVYYYANGDFDQTDILTYHNYDIKILNSFDTFEEAYRKYEEIKKDKTDIINNMDKFNL